jgi:hypothetical protein
VPFSELQEGQVVEFAVEETPQGPKARRIHLATTSRITPYGRTSEMPSDAASS